MKRKTISFRLEGTIKVPVNVKLSEVEEWLEDHFGIDSNCDADNPLEDDYEAETSIEYNSIEVM